MKLKQIIIVCNNVNICNSYISFAIYEVAYLTFCH